MVTAFNPLEELDDQTHRVAVIDDDDSFRVAVVRMLQICGRTAIGYRCAGEYLLSNPTDCTSCIVLDMYMPGPSGLELLDSLAKQATSPPVVFVTGFGDIPTSVRAIKAGAVDFLTKPIDRDRLLQAVDRALALDAQRRSEWREQQELHERYVQLSSYERNVFAGVANGKLNKQLAGSLGICERSIKSYRARVMRKMRVTSLAGLVKTARLLGIIATTPSTKPPLDVPMHGNLHRHVPSDHMSMY